jgi:hypothetical protein
VVLRLTEDGFNIRNSLRAVLTNKTLEKMKTMNPYQEHIDLMLLNIGSKGHITDEIGTIECFKGYNGELLTISDVSDEAFYVVTNEHNISWFADCNEFEILNK